MTLKNITIPELILCLFFLAEDSIHMVFIWEMSFLEKRQVVLYGAHLSVTTGYRSKTSHHGHGKEVTFNRLFQFVLVLQYFRGRSSSSCPSKVHSNMYSTRPATFMTMMLTIHRENLLLWATPHESSKQKVINYFYSFLTLFPLVTSHWLLLRVHGIYLYLVLQFNPSCWT